MLDTHFILSAYPQFSWFEKITESSKKPGIVLGFLLYDKEVNDGYHF